MQHLVRLSDWSPTDVDAVLALADAYRAGQGPRFDGAAALFFPPSSLRTRITIERGTALMGLQPITFPPEVLDKPEALEDVAAYLASWIDVLVVRHPDIGVLDRLAAADQLPVINAMTSSNHPCEVLSDLSALAQETDPHALRYLFIGADGNIARAWGELAHLLGLDLVQCSPADLRTPGIAWTDDLETAVSRADVIVTDGPGPHGTALEPYRITAALLDRAPAEARFAPCPPFVRGREASADALAHPAFVGHDFKRHLLPVQQAVIAHLLRKHRRTGSTGASAPSARALG